MGRKASPGALLLAACGLGLAMPASAEVTRETTDSFVSRHEVVVEGSPKDVWLALISPANWWRSEHTWSGAAENLVLTPQAGGCFCETIPEVDEPGRFTLQGSVEHMRVIQAYPEQGLRMQGALGPLQSEPVTGVLTIAISTVDDGTRIVWEYYVGGPMRYDVPVIAKAVDGVMGAQLAALADQLGPVAMPGSDVPAEEAEEATDEPTPTMSDEVEVPAQKALPQLSPKPTLPAAGRSAPKPQPKPAPKPADPKPASVDEAFSDFTEEPGR